MADDPVEGDPSVGLVGATGEEGGVHDPDAERRFDLEVVAGGVLAAGIWKRSRVGDSPIWARPYRAARCRRGTLVPAV